MLNSLSVVYYDTALEAACADLPGTRLGAWLESQPASKDTTRLEVKLGQACGKLCLMWQAADWAIEAEREFWYTTVQEAPALFGGCAVVVRYHLEAFVLFARSALDISADVFGSLLPDPFPRGRFDSFNDLAKKISKHGPEELRTYVDQMRGIDTSWLSILSGTERGRSLRDKISHQTEFPLEYQELRQGSQKEYATVMVGEGFVPLSQFIESVRDGVIDGFRRLEQACIESPGSTN